MNLLQFAALAVSAVVLLLLALTLVSLTVAGNTELLRQLDEARSALAIIAGLMGW